MNRRFLKITALVLAACIVLSLVHVCLCREESCPVCAVLRIVLFLALFTIASITGSAALKRLRRRCLICSAVSLFSLKTLLLC
ncbi:MAG: hypothetical protein K5784_08305 [Clostridiales bacterium]|nr:hypothetical protein [Clostridiales bacterium]